MSPPARQTCPRPGVAVLALVSGAVASCHGLIGEERGGASEPRRRAGPEPGAPAAPDRAAGAPPPSPAAAEPAGAGEVPAPAAGGRGLHRLNNAEYRNTVRDLFGIAADPARFAEAMQIVDALPADDRGVDGYDNDAAALRLSALHIDAYFRAAEALTTAALGAPGPSRARIFVCAEASAACAQQILRAFARRAWRRPPTDGEVARLVKVAEAVGAAGGSFDAGIAAALQGALLSAHFVFRVELGPPGSFGRRRLTEHELAARLSYFLWSSTPDDELLGLADGQQLAARLAAQVQRLMASDKAAALLDNFAGQWLALRNLDGAEPDPDLYPKFDEKLRAAMRQETQLVLGEMLRSGRPMDELLTAKFSFVNDRLALHYGLSGISGGVFRRVALEPGTHRGGLLTHGSVLTLTSHPDQSSPVRRGQWVLENLLCSSPPPPPDTLPVPDLPGDKVNAPTLRQQLEQHRAKPVCEACHREMDPIGLALENFDAVGAYRTRYAGSRQAVDSTGQLPGGQTVRSAAELAAIVARDPRLGRCLARNLLMYALGRGANSADDKTVDAVQEGGLGLPSLVLAIASSETFGSRPAIAPLH